MTLWIMTSLLLHAAALAQTTPADPGLQSELSALEAQGFKTQQIVSSTVKGVPLSAVLLRNPVKKLDKLNVYARLKARTFLVYTHPTAVDRLELGTDAPSGKGWGDLLRDGSRAIAYQATTAGLNKRVLYVLRCSGVKVRRVAAFPEGALQDLDKDGRLEAVSRSLPLGRFFSTGCQEFQTLSQNAFRTRVYRWQGGAFVDASERFPSFYDADIARLQERLSLTPKEKRPGEFLGDAIATYYDYEAKGERRKGWESLSRRLQPPSVSLPQVAQCLEKAKADLRQKLEIPADW